MIINICALKRNSICFFQANDEFSVAIAVRLHRRLELANDKIYMISCGKSGFQNSRYDSRNMNANVQQNIVIQETESGYARTCICTHAHTER